MTIITGIEVPNYLDIENYMCSLKIAYQYFSHLNWEMHEKQGLRFSSANNNLVYVLALDGWNQQISSVCLGDREPAGRGEHGPLHSLLW